MKLNVLDGEKRPTPQNIISQPNILSNFVYNLFNMVLVTSYSNLAFCSQIHRNHPNETKNEFLKSFPSIDKYADAIYLL